jgi:hypothetical protein
MGSICEASGGAGETWSSGGVFRYTGRAVKRMGSLSKFYISKILSEMRFGRCEHFVWVETYRIEGLPYSLRILVIE